MSTIGLKKSPSNPSLLVPVIKGPFLILFYVQLERYLLPPLPWAHQINLQLVGQDFGSWESTCRPHLPILNTRSSIMLFRSVQNSQYNLFHFKNRII